METQQDAVNVLNEIADTVLHWNLGNISEKQAMNKMNDIFKKYATAMVNAN